MKALFFVCVSSVSTILNVARPNEALLGDIDIAMKIRLPRTRQLTQPSEGLFAWNGFEQFISCTRSPRMNENIKWISGIRVTAFTKMVNH